MAPFVFGIGLSIMAVFLILLVLVQRGRGGGLTGALGGVGGSSAFGAKAGDVFTKITIVAATIWIVTCVGAAYWAGHRSDVLGDEGPALNIPPASDSIEEIPATAPQSDDAATTPPVEEAASTDSEAAE